jgi:hypothetical protein
MSEHRTPAWERDSARRRLMEQEACPLWPRCCYQRLADYQDLLAREEDWSLAELFIIETGIEDALCCTYANSPDAAMRRYAARQLLDPWWQRPLTEETSR